MQTGMKITQLLGLCTVATALLLTPGAAQAKGTPAGGEPGAKQALEIAQQSASELSGHFEHAGSIVFFTSHREASGATSARVEIGPLVLEATREPVHGDVTWTGHGDSLILPDREALTALAIELNQGLFARNDLPAHEDFFHRLVNYWAEAPLGLALEERTVVRPEATIGRPGPRQEGAPEGCYFADNNGITYFSCSYNNKVVCHDQNGGGHCWLCQSVLAGCGGECLGECGPGCYGLNIVTWDCGDHDQCCRQHGGCTNPFDSECGDEYFEAADDFLDGTPNCWFCGGI